ncbi:MAG: MarC family protein [Thermodesulfobacteriota bacterium]
MPEQGDLQFALVAVTTLLVVVDPLGVLPIFTALTADRTADERRDVLRRAVGVGFAVALFFLVAGHRALAYLGVTVHAFAISGGILLFATAMPMLFGHRPATQRAAPEERPDAEPDGGVRTAGAADADIAIFPLAIPLLAGPGAITTVLLLTARSRGEPVKLAILAAALVAVFLVTWLVLGVASSWLLRRIGTTGIHVATRVLGILLAALAVQFVLNGAAEYVRTLQTGAAC